MKTTFVRFLVAVVLCAVATNLWAGPFRSLVIDAGAHSDIMVPDGVFMHVRNFTQAGGTARGVVTVTITGQATSTIVLTATINEPQSPTPTPAPSALEPINSVIIAGPATVTFTAGDVAAFVTYRKDKD
jgi:hypothetical protein